VNAAAQAQGRASAWAALLTQFNLHVARFAHPSWCTASVSARAESQLSAWLLQELNLQDEFDWEMSDPQRRVWLLDTPALTRLAEEVALAMHRDWLVRVIEGARLRTLMTSLDRGALRFVVEEVPQGAFHYRAPLVNFETDAPSEIVAELRAAGARTLIALLRLEWRAVRGRAPLHFDRAWQLAEVPPFASEHCAQALELICGKLIPRRFPEWAWLF
jgi:hypothetical protein